MGAEKHYSHYARTDLKHYCCPRSMERGVAMGIFWKSLTIALPIMTFAPSPALACVDFAPFRIEGIRGAEAIFVGEVVSYERLEREAQRFPSFGLLRVRVRQIIKGDVAPDIYVFWTSNFGIRKYLDLPPRAIFAATTKYDAETAFHVQNESGNDFTRSKLLRLSGSPCASDYILDYTPGNMEAINKVLRGEKVGERDYRVVIDSMAGLAAEREFREERSWREIKRAAIFGLACGALLCAFIGLWWRLRRNMKR